jgi:glycosyltransferase involved in cell wall biosynthesis
MLISVTIPVYNNPNGLVLSLISLISQEYSNWEAIVVDDGSDISLIDLIRDFNDKRIIFHRFNKNKGRPAARQKTFELIQGDYCAFLDAGDSFDRTYLLKAADLFKKNKLLAVSQSMTINYKSLKYHSFYNEGLFSVKDLRFQNISFASSIFESKVCKNYVFNKKLKYSQDKHFLNYISSNYEGKIALLNTHNYIYNQGCNMKSNIIFKKYYYDFLRILEEKNLIRLIKAFVKIPFFFIVNVIFGYEMILKLRYKKDK